MNYLKSILHRHWLPLLFALIVGIITITPALTFRLALQSDFRGVDFLPLDDEEFYLARMHEVADGYPLVGSMPYFEYKNNPAVLPPTMENIYSFVARATDLTLQDVIIIGKFLLPALIFFLIYLLLINLTAETLAAKINAVAGGLLATLGFYLNDFSRVINILKGAAHQGGMMLWTRPVNPASGALFLLLFLNFLWLVVIKKKRWAMLPAAIALAFSFGTYFFSWGAALAVTGVWTLLFIIRKKYAALRDIIMTVLLGIILAAPYWYLVYTSSTHPLFSDAAGRFGLIFSHNFILNKFLLLGAGVLIIGLILYFWNGENRDKNNEWVYFCLALIGGGLLAFNQQAITGRTIWPFHFSQYTILFVYVTALTVIYHGLRLRSIWVWRSAIALIIVASLGMGIYMEAAGFKDDAPRFVDRQTLAGVFTWLNQNTPKDSVIFVRNGPTRETGLERLIPAYTHNNVYHSSPGYALAPYERYYHNYLSLLRMKGVVPEVIEYYLIDNRDEAVGYLHTQLLTVFGNSAAFPEVRDEKLEETLSRLPTDYREFMKKDFKNELKKYRIDYVLAEGGLPPAVWVDLGRPSSIMIDASTNIIIYDL